MFNIHNTVTMTIVPQQATPRAYACVLCVRVCVRARACVCVCARVCVTAPLTGVEDGSKHPALAVSHSQPRLDVLLDDGDAARPLQRGGAPGEGLAPVPLQHPVVIVLAVHLSKVKG